MKNRNFIVIEGVDGVGKTTLVNKLKEHYKGNRNVVFTREPGGTPEAEEIRNLIFNNTMSKRVELELFNTARQLHINDLVEPSLDECKVVVCDRFILSSMVYQSLGDEITQEEILCSNRAFLYRLHDNMQMHFLSCEPELIEKRLIKRKGGNRLDSANFDDILENIKRYDNAMKIHKAGKYSSDVPIRLHMCNRGVYWATKALIREIDRLLLAEQE